MSTGPVIARVLTLIAPLSCDRVLPAPGGDVMPPRAPFGLGRLTLSLEGALSPMSNLRYGMLGSALGGQGGVLAGGWAH